MAQIRPEEMGVVENEIFAMPFNGEEILFTLEKPDAERLHAAAAARNMSMPEYLVALFKRVMRNPKSPWNLLALPKGWMVCSNGSKPKDKPKKRRRPKLNLIPAFFTSALLLHELFDYLQ